MEPNTNRPAFCRAIYTKFVGPTDTKGARIIAREPIGKKRIVRSYDHAKDTGDAHAAVARELSDMLDSDTSYTPRDWNRAVCGESQDGRGYVYLVPYCEPTTGEGAR